MPSSQLSGAHLAPPGVTTRGGGRALRVASVPADHVYVRHLAAPGPAGLDGVVRLPDPGAHGPDAAPWWPPSMLDERWVRSHAADFDVFHVHFGFDAVPVEALEALVVALRELRRPLVMTVHDLRNPHHRDPAAHDRALAVLVGAAAEVITLTPGAADEVRHRFGRAATVIPHPHVVDPERVRHPAPASPSDRPFTVGIHLKSVRANMFTLDLVDVVADALAALGDAVLRVDVHDVVDDPSHHAHVPQLLGRLRERSDAGSIALRVHPFFTDDELWDYLEALDASLLPYRFGTHSGWLEACADLGTTVIAPTCGWYHQQQPVLVYDADEWGFDAEGVRTAVGHAHRLRPRWQADPTWRRWQRAAVAAAHREVYERVRG